MNSAVNNLKKTPPQTLYSRSYRLIVIETLPQGLLSVEHHELKNAWTSAALKWLGPNFSAILPSCSPLEFKSCSCFAQLYQKVLDKECVKCANQTATKSTELQLANFWQITPSALEKYHRSLFLYEQYCKYWFIFLFKSIPQHFSSAKGLPNMHRMIAYDPWFLLMDTK